MTNVSIRALTDALEKSGVSGNQTSSQNPFVREQIANQVRSSDTRTPQLKSNYQSVLQKVAEMDQRLSQMYSDPTSSMYIEKPSARQNLTTGASQTGYRQLGDIKGQIASSQRDTEDQVNQAVDLYDQLIQAQKQVATTRKSSSTSTAKGGTTGTRSTGGSTDKELEAIRKELGLNLTDRAHIYDPEAQEVFLTAPVDFQKYILRDLFTHPEVDQALTEDDNSQYPLGKTRGFSANAVRAWLENWNSTFKGK